MDPPNLLGARWTHSTLHWLAQFWNNIIDSIIKNFFQLERPLLHFKERYNLHLLFQGFNLTNRADYGNNIVNSTGSGSFLQPAGFINPSTSSAVLPRAFVGEFGVRLTF